MLQIKIEERIVLGILSKGKRNRERKKTLLPAVVCLVGTEGTVGTPAGTTVSLTRAAACAALESDARLSSAVAAFFSAAAAALLDAARVLGGMIMSLDFKEICSKNLQMDGESRVVNSRVREESSLIFDRKREIISLTDLRVYL